MNKLAALLALALASVALVACGGSDSNTTTTTEGGEANAGAAAEGGEKSGGGGESTVELEADPNGGLAYTTDEATAKAGKVTIDFKNPQGLTHDVAIEDESGETIGKTELIAESQTSTTIDLKPGTYKYYCTVPGHREAGMEGTLVVK
jgi:plastocyanin